MSDGYSVGGALSFGQQALMAEWHRLVAKHALTCWVCGETKPCCLPPLAKAGA